MTAILASAGRSRPARLAAQGAVLALVAAGTSAFATLHKSVEVDVDGRSVVVSTFGRTVGDVLGAAGVQVGERDLVVPGVGAPVSSGDEVVVRLARELDVVVDGELRTVWTTALTVGDAIEALGVRDQGALVSVSRSARLPGGPVHVSTVKSVSVAADGAVAVLETNAPTVRDALVEAGVVLEEFDRVSVPLDAVATDGLVVSVARAVVSLDTTSESLGFDERTVKDASLAKGTKVVRTEGRKGSRETTHQVVTVDGVEVDRQVLASVVVAEPTDRVVVVGTRKAAAPPSGKGRDADSLNWAALAKCESGGSPTIVSKSGKYHGLYQFSVGTWKSVGGKGLPSEASAAEQLKRAKILYNRSGAGPWPHCGPRLFS